MLFFNELENLLYQIGKIRKSYTSLQNIFVVKQSL